jgi:holo-[acyl-carrier protein] synthase
MTGIGADVVSVERLEAALGRTPELAGRVFSAGEWAFCRARRAPGRHLAARFAAKEAFLKALGLGIFSGVSLADVEVQPGPAGAPCLSLGPTAAAALRRRGGGAPLLTLSYSAGRALALVVVP